MRRIKLIFTCVMVLSIAVASLSFAMAKIPGKGRVASADDLIYPIGVGLVVDAGNVTSTSAATSQTVTVPGFFMAVNDLNKVSDEVSIKPYIENTGVGDVIAKTNALLAKQISLLSGGQTSGNAVKSAPLAVDARVVYAGGNSASDDLTGCTPELIKQGFLPSKTPLSGSCFLHNGYFYRTHGLGTDWGKAGAYYANNHADYESLTKAAGIIRHEDPDGDGIYTDDAFGRPTIDGFISEFESEEDNSFSTIVRFQGSTSVDGYKTSVIVPLLNEDPQIIVGVWRSSDLVKFLQAWEEYYNENYPTKEAQMKAIKFIHMGSVRPSTEYLDMRNWAANTVGIQPHFDDQSPGYSAWKSLALDYDYSADEKVPSEYQGYDAYTMFDEFEEPRFRHALAQYDGLMIYFLALKKAQVEFGSALEGENNYKDNPLIKQKILEVAGPAYPEDPEEKIVYPGMFKQACDWIEEGYDINYQGASSNMDLNESGNVEGLPYLVWTVDGTTGAADDICTFNPIDGTGTCSLSD